MLILITRHSKVFFENIYLSNIEHDVTMSKVQFLSLLPRECMSSYFFLKTFFMYARPIPVQTKVHFKNLQCLAVTYDMGFSFDVVKRGMFFSFV